MSLASKTLLEINGKDYTSKVKVPTWKVNCVDTIEEWTDANYVKHYVLAHRHVSGTFTLLFDSPDDYDAFLDDLHAVEYSDPSDYETNTSRCYRSIRLYCNNDKYASGETDVKYRVYPKFTRLIFEPANELCYIGTGKYNGIDCSVEGDIIR